MGAGKNPCNNLHSNEYIKETKSRKVNNKLGPFYDTQKLTYCCNVPVLLQLFHTVLKYVQYSAAKSKERDMNKHKAFCIIKHNFDTYFVLNETQKIS